MVVANVVHISNTTMRTFYVHAGDIFYTPQVGGKPCCGAIEVPPGFDQSADGLAVPWEGMTLSGLAITAAPTEEASRDVLRCVVGPTEWDTEDRDWIQFRASDWKNVEQDRWWPLGARHYFGAVGGSVDLQLTFRDARSNTESPADIAELVHFERAVLCASPNTVFLNVFDLASTLTFPNAILNNTMMKTLGAFHAAVEVYGEEWSFYRTPNPESSGVCKSLRPRSHPVHVFRQSINLGTTNLAEWEVRYLVRSRLAPLWRGGRYDLLHRNCIHFCDEMVLALGVKPVPTNVCSLHEAGASFFWPLCYAMGWETTSDRPRRPAIEDRRAAKEPKVKAASNTTTATADVAF